MRKIRYLLGVMAVTASVLLVAPTAAVAGDSPTAFTASGRGAATYIDSNDSVHACDFYPDDGIGIKAVLSVQQADGSWLEKAPVASFSGCNTGIRDVVRENASLRIVACDIQGGTSWNCQGWTFGGG